jgi:phosphoribosyl-ATP pyrophosphohydrolase
MTDDIFARLEATFAARKNADPAASYTASLLSNGPDAILKKIGEEATELVLASKDGDAKAIVHEASDLLFHTLLLLSFHGLTLSDVQQELARREGVSGIEEKKSRMVSVPRSSS